MRRRKTRDELLGHLKDSLGVMEVNIGAYKSGRMECWMPIATQMFKLLCDHRYGGPLVPRLFPDLKLHPVLGAPSDKAERQKRGVQWIWTAPPSEIDEVGIHITLFDESSPRKPLSEWLEQIIQVSNGEDISIRNLIELMRNNESAHLSLSKLGGKPQFIKSAFTIYEHGKEWAGYTRLIIRIGEYVLSELCNLSEVGDLPRVTSAIVPPNVIPLINRGNEYLDLAETENMATNLQHAVDAFQEALIECIPGSLKATYSAIKFSLGKAYGELARVENRGEYLLYALALYEQALLNCHPDDELPLYAIVEDGLGRTYLDLSEIEDKEFNLERSIEAFERALAALNRQENPTVFARVRHNMGVAYLKLSETRERETNLRLAIAIFHEVLQYRDAQSDPKNYALTQQCLGNAYFWLSKLDESIENQQQALACWKQAEHFYRQAGLAALADLMHSWSDKVR